MLLGHDIARLGGEFGTDFAAPRSKFKCPSRPGGSLHRRNVFPGFVVARTVSMMHRKEHAQPSLSRSRQQLQHMRNAIVGFCDALDAIPEFAALGYEIVVGIYEEKPSSLLLKPQIGHALPSYALADASSRLLEEFSDRYGTCRPFSDRRGDLLGAAVPRVTGGKHTRHAALEGQRLVAAVRVVGEIMAGQHEPVLVHFHVIVQERRVRLLPDENEGRRRVDLLHHPAVPVVIPDRLEP